MAKIVLERPGPDEPGYLKRARKALEFQSKIKVGPSPEVLDEMVHWLATYVTDPKDPVQAMEALWDASENQFQEILKEIAGGDENPTE